MSNYKGYFLKTLGLKEDSLPGGLGDSLKERDVDPQELQMGIETEMEHTNDELLAKEIALDHLAEDPKYYSNLKNAGADATFSKEPKPNIPMMSKLFSTPKTVTSPVIAVGVRGTRTGLLPAGGIVADPEKARLGGFELVQNVKPNSQGAIEDTPVSAEIGSDGGHFTPMNAEIVKGDPPITSVKGTDQIHPMQVQQIGNVPFNDDGTSRPGTEKKCCKGVWGITVDAPPSVDVDIDLNESATPLQGENSQLIRRWKKLANI